MGARKPSFATKSSVICSLWTMTRGTRKGITLKEFRTVLTQTQTQLAIYHSARPFYITILKKHCTIYFSKLMDFFIELNEFQCCEVLRYVDCVTMLQKGAFNLQSPCREISAVFGVCGGKLSFSNSQEEIALGMSRGSRRSNYNYRDYN